MGANEIYSKYRECVDNVACIMSHYAKYQHCFAMDTINHDLQPIFNRICYTYAKMMVLVNDDMVFNPGYLANEFTYEDCELMIADKQTFINGVLEFMDEEREKIIAVIACTPCLTEKYCLNDVLFQVNLAQKLKDKTEAMIKTSQYFYRVA